MSRPPEAAPPVRLTDLLAHREVIGDRIDAAVAAAVTGGRWIMGPEVAALEAELSRFCGAGHAVACSNGTDALKLALLALGFRPGDAVVCPSFTFTATAEVIALLGGVPLFADCEAGGFNLDPDSAAAAVDEGRAAGLRPVGVIAVDLFGVVHDHARVAALCEREGLWLVDDAAQSFGATLDGRPVGSFGAITATSFFPAKPLGCYGDGGATFTDDARLAERMRSLRVHGKGTDKYDNVAVGLNARLDTIQAAVLLEKLAIFGDELTSRRAVAAAYEEGFAGLDGIVDTPAVPPGCDPSWAQYTIRTPHRDALARRLAAVGIETAVYYPRPLHRQPAYSNGPGAGLVDLTVAERHAAEVLSLPMHPYLRPDEIDRVIEAVTGAMAMAADERA